MLKQKRLRDYGLVIGSMKPGVLNAITDVEGVRVGHSTIDNAAAKTGVTAILPHPGNLFKEKVIAACHVINGFGKSAGLVQITEMGTVETPIILTNTLSVGTAFEAVVEYMLEMNSDIGLESPTVNPLICECNDGYLNDIRGRHVRVENVHEAIAACGLEFTEGNAGAGMGMSCYEMKGGIGSASRILTLNGNSFTVGTLVLTNFGLLGDLYINGAAAGKELEEIRRKTSASSVQNWKTTPVTRDKGSVIIIIATDIPLSERQLGRIARRSANGLARTGSYMGSGSGEICIAFSTKNKVPACIKECVLQAYSFNEAYMDDVFRAVVESVEEAVLNSLICAERVIGRNGNMRFSLSEHMNLLIK